MRVSVLVMTYNHAEYIRAALESVLMQRTPFDFEILISEDCSTDGTRAIVQEYQQRYPQRIRLLLSTENLHNNTVVTRGIEAARGEYIALLDGDDTWTSEDKLAKQVAFLDEHPECSVCFHNATVVGETNAGLVWQWTPAAHPQITGLEDIWLGNYIATCSTMFRRWRSGQLPAWYIDMFPITDWPLHILNAERGKIGYINETMGVYRYHSRGYYSPLSEAEKQRETLKFYQTMRHNFAGKYDRLIDIAIAKYFVEWAEEYAERGEIKQGRTTFRNAFAGRVINRHVPAARVAALSFKLYLPGAAKLLAPSPQRL